MVKTMTGQAGKQAGWRNKKWKYIAIAVVVITMLFITPMLLVITMPVLGLIWWIRKRKAKAQQRQNLKNLKQSLKQNLLN
jgi:ABC-type Fe3+ transport system permease subunit